MIFLFLFLNEEIIQMLFGGILLWITFNELYYRCTARRAISLILINFNTPKMMRTFLVGINLNELRLLGDLLVIAWKSTFYANRADLPRL